MKKLNNKGFSLVEILTALAIGSIVLLGVVAFMNGGSVTYRTASTQIGLQDDVQETTNYVNDLLQKSMDVVFDDNKGILYMFMPKTVQYSGGYTIEYEIYYLIHDEAEGKMYVHNRIVQPDDYDDLTIYSSDKSTYYSNEHLLASGVKDFEVSIQRDPNTLEPALVTFDISFIKNDADRDGAIAVRPRNRTWTYDPTKDRFFNVINVTL